MTPAEASAKVQLHPRFQWISDASGPCKDSEPSPKAERHSGAVSLKRDGKQGVVLNPHLAMTQAEDFPTRPTEFEGGYEYLTFTV